MALNPSNAIPGSRSLKGLVGFLRQETAYTQRRMDGFIRLMISSAICIVISMALQVPLLGITVVIIYFISQDNIVLTRTLCIAAVVAGTIGAVVSVLVLKVSIDIPFLRILLSALVVFACAFMMRASKLGPVFYVIALIVIYVQSFVDEVSNGEILVRGTMWAWIAAVYPIAVTLAVNWWIKPANPEMQMQEEALRILCAIQLDLEKATKDLVWHRSDNSLKDVENGVVTISKLQGYCFSLNKGSYWVGSKGNLFLETLQAIYAGCKSPCQSSIPLDASSTLFLRGVLNQVNGASGALENGNVFGLAWSGIEMPQKLPYPINEIAHAMHFANSASASSFPKFSPPIEPAIATDVKTNPVYWQFAAKTCLATLLCYFFYRAVDWQGIHTVMLTCLIVALPGLGPSMQKATLRIAGCLIGSLLALLTTVYVLPHVTDLTGLLFMTIPVLSVGAWIAMGSEKISYAGIQITFAFTLATLESFGPLINLTEIRDRLIGVILGVTVSAAIQVFVWADSDKNPLQKKLAAILKDLSDLCSPRSLHGPYSKVCLLRQSAWQNIFDAEASLENLLTEPNRQIENRERFILSLRNWIADSRRLLLVMSEINYRLRSEVEPDKSSEINRFFEEASKILLAGSHCLERLESMRDAKIAFNLPKISPEVSGLNEFHGILKSYFLQLNTLPEINKVR